MNHQHKERRLAVRGPAYRNAVERLEEALERNTHGSNAEKIDALGRMMFPEIWDGEAASDRPQIPQ